MLLDTDHLNDFGKFHPIFYPRRGTCSLLLDIQAPVWRLLRVKLKKKKKCAPLISLGMRQALKESPQQRSCIEVRAGPVAAGGHPAMGGHPPFPPPGHRDVFSRPHQELAGSVGAQVTLGATFLVAQAIQNSFQQNNGLSRLPAVQLLCH